MWQFALLAALAAQPPQTDSGAIVRHVEIERNDVFVLDDSLAWYKRWMNLLHIKTQENVIRREMLFTPGTPYDSALAAETERNLRGLNIFGTVRVDSVHTDSGLVARVRTVDAWTTKPYLSFRSSGGQATYGIGINESNLLGRLISVGLKFKHEPDRNSVEFSGKLPRIIQNKVSISGSYTTLSDGKKGFTEVGMPWLSLSAPAMLLSNAEVFDGRVLQFVGGDTVPVDSLQRRFGIVRLFAGKSFAANPGGYRRLQLQAQIRREDFSDITNRDTLPRTVTGETQLSFEGRRAKYIVTNNYRNIGPDEDVDLSTTVKAGLAIAPRAWGYEHNALGPVIDAQMGRAWGNTFGIARITASGLYTTSGTDSSTIIITGQGATKVNATHAAAFYVGGGWQVNPFPGNEFDLGLTRGPRAFPQHAFTGDRYFFTSAEYRVIAIPSLFDLVGIGVAGFADYGGAWYRGSTRRTGTDIGAGLRIGSSRFPSLNGAARVDFAYRFPNDREAGRLVVVLGTGYVFERTR